MLLKSGREGCGHVGGGGGDSGVEPGGGGGGERERERERGICGVFCSSTCTTPSDGGMLVVTVVLPGRLPLLEHVLDSTGCLRLSQSGLDSTPPFSLPPPVLVSSAMARREGILSQIGYGICVSE